MALIKVNYIDNETVITAANMNAIQDEVIKNSEIIENGIAAPTLRATYDEETQTMKFENVPKEVEDQLYAPSGYGYGGNAIYLGRPSTESEEEQVIADFYSTLKANDTALIAWEDNKSWRWYAQIAKSSDNFGTILAHSAVNSGSIKLKTLYSGTWQPWEWENPPMSLGVEYRTTERWNGKAVYTKLVNCGYLAAVGRIKEYAHASDAVNIVRVTGSLSTGDVLPYHNTNTEIEVSCTPDNVKIKTIAWEYTTPAVTEVQATVQIWYTKD